MSKQTKGPWNLLLEGHKHYTPGCGEYPHIENEDGETVIDGAWYSSICNEDDLSLISAAPCLLSALQGMLEMYAQLVNCGDCGNWDAESEKEVIAGRKAIAKALGRDQ